MKTPKKQSKFLFKMVKHGKASSEGGYLITYTVFLLEDDNSKIYVI